jgi:FtsH-binding integral membrane protein
MATSLLQGHSSDSTSTMKPAAEHYPPAGSDMEGGFQSGQPVYSHSAAIKAGFLRKVYGILSIQLLFTCCSSAFFMFHEPTRNYVLANPSMLMAASIAPFGFLLALFCYKDRHPLNMALLGGFTVCMTYTVGVVCAAYYQNHMGVIVLQALILTASVFISLTTYVLVTKKDFSFLGGGLFAGLMILIVW